MSPAPRRDFGDVEVPNAADVREWLDTLITISAILYPVVTTWCIASISWEQAMRKEIFYVLLHYKVDLPAAPCGPAHLHTDRTPPRLRSFPAK